jgi:hypothetical protein
MFFAIAEGLVRCRVAGREEALEDVAREQREQIARDERTENADILEHLHEARAFFRSLGFREFLPEEQQRVEHGRHEVERELAFPSHVHLVTEQPPGHHADHHARWPRSMQDVEVMGAVLRV